MTRKLRGVENLRFDDKQNYEVFFVFRYFPWAIF